MGRHSAPDDDIDERSSVAVVPNRRPSPGRHSLADGAEQQGSTDEIPALVDPVVDMPVPEAMTDLIPVIADEKADASATKPAQPQVGAATLSDLALIRRHADVRARCVAGLLVPFVLYVAVLLVIGPLSWVRLLLWIWIPLITAGVLVGLFLDIGHRRYDTAPAGASGSSDRP